MRVKKITELSRISIQEFKDANKIPLIIVLDNIRSLNNIGSIFRISDAFRISAIYLCGITACPPHTDIHKTALGAEDSVDWLYFPKTEDAIQYLKKNNHIVYAVEQVEGSVLLDNLKLDAHARYALIVGNEVKGVTQPVVDLCDFCVEIPQFGTKHSLNVSIATGIAIWEFQKQLGLNNL